MDVKLGVLADFASISREGKLNIMGIFDEINPRQLPAGLPIFYVVVSLTTGAFEFDTDKNVEILLQAEDGQIILRIQQTAHIPRPARPGTQGTLNVIHALVGVLFPEVGTYEFVVVVDGHADRHKIPVRVNEPPAA